MQKKIMIIFFFFGIIACIGMIILAYKLVKERYTLLRNVGKFPLQFTSKETSHKIPLYKKFLRHKYSRGTAYDRAKLRTNRFQKNYVY